MTKKTGNTGAEKLRGRAPPMTHGVYLLYRLFKDSSTKSYGEEKPNRYSTNNNGKTRSMAHLEPDSPEWFAWLSGLGSFHFTGKCGRFTARQEHKQRGNAYWYAYRKAHKLRLKRYLGTTEKLRLSYLERIATLMNEAALGAISEDEALNVRSKAPPPDGLRVGPLTVIWHEGMLSVRTSTERHVLNGIEAAELLSYLYDQRSFLLEHRQ
jgi:hypothetical protein